MNSVEIEQLKQDLATKVGTLENKINSGKINDETSLELVANYKEYEKNGITIEELKLLYDDVILALS